MGCFPRVVQALPPPEDIPEEILRTEIITEGRSPIDGKLLSAAEYAELQASLQLDSPPEPMVSREIKHLLFLLRIRSQIRLILPFLDF
ncbi:glutathione S-transferase [Phormidium sp. LEGE 05292]|nr:glutathione S-transferase [Phormidium sp. LEGE 05292]